mmetsp:Transcript_104087/g.315941  ORF Transcript_104087/g.315941 Transcript_104087/m.315941 type:complete len:294 (+) Transcript_104087:84-965(+)
MADVLQQVACGCAAGIVADVITHPLSTVKTRLQVQGSGGGGHGAVAYRGVTHALATIVRSEGIGALYRGLGAVLVGAAPAQGLYFGGYESAKALLGAGQSGVGNFAAGVCAQLCGSICWVPMDVIKERLQVEGQVKLAARAYTGSFNAFSHIMKHEGLVGLYRAFPVHQLTWAPFNGCYFMIYEKCKTLCIDAGYEDGHDNLEPTAQLCCGATAGIIAGAVTNPVDVLKTRLQVAMANPEMFPYTNSWQAFRHLLRHEGPAALMDGAFCRVIWLAPRLTICVAAYEQLKAWLS